MPLRKQGSFLIFVACLTLALYNVPHQFKFMPVFTHTPPVPTDFFQVKSAGELITGQGFAYEEHKVITEDGFILTLHRIPAKNNNGTQQGAVLLQHGVLDSGTSWVFLDVEHSLAYMLSTAGFDVWLGNCRGASKHHINHSYDQPEFWNWNTDDLIQFDLPTMVNYVVKISKFEKISYVGHSMGALLGFAGFTNENQELASKINSFIGLAPAASFKKLPSLMDTFFPTPKYIIGLVQSLVELLSPATRIHAFDTIREGLFIPVCSRYSGFCREMLCGIAGCKDTNLFEHSSMSVTFSLYPAEASMANLVQFAQWETSGVISMFDYGEEENQARYGSATPKPYNVSDLAIPVAIFYGGVDKIVSPFRVRSAISALPKEKITEVHYFPDYGHADFLWSQEGKDTLYPHVISLLQKRCVSTIDQPRREIHLPSSVPIRVGLNTTVMVGVTTRYFYFWLVFPALMFCITVGLVLLLLIKPDQRKEGEFPPSPNMFIGSGKYPAATFSQELILKRKGGTGSAYFSDPSLGFGELSNFSYKAGNRIDFKQLLEEKADVIGPYCVDDERKQIVFVETEANFDPAETGPFYFQSQRDNAIRLYTVPFEEYHRVIAELPNTHTNNLLLVYNTSRCGSTLLSKCCDNITEMQAISEPDVFSSLAHIASESKGTRDKDIVDIARSSGRLLCYLRRRKNPDRDAICLKFRFQTIYINKLIKEALPESKPIFLYRNALDVIDSMGAAFINTGAYKLIRAAGIDTFYIWHISTLPHHLWKLLPLIRDKRFPMAAFKPLGAVAPFVFTWLSVMQTAIEAQKEGLIQVSIRYEDMCKGKEDYVRKMLEAVEMMPSKNEVAIDKRNSDVFSADVHEGVTKSSRTSINQHTGELQRSEHVYLKPVEVHMIQNILSYHETILYSDYTIDGTLAL